MANMIDPFHEQRRHTGAQRYGSVKNEAPMDLTTEEFSKIAGWKYETGVVRPEITQEGDNLRLTGFDEKGKQISSIIKRIKR